MKAAIVEIKNKNAVKIAARVLREGGLIIYPTETCYALGCLFDKEKAKEKVLRIKKRSKYLPAMVSNLEVAKRYTDIPKVAEKLIFAFYPRLLTLIVNDNFAFRIPSHPFALELAKKVKKPIVSVSVRGKSKVCEISKIKKLFSRKVDLIVDAGNLNCTQETIFDLRTLEVVQEGEIKSKEVEEILRLYGIKLK
jgi:L-threonylcarbamoyladenylate synthase